MAEYTEEDIEELREQLTLQINEAINERPADGYIPSYELFDAVDEAFRQSPVSDPQK